MIWKAKWIKPSKDMGDIAPVYAVNFVLKKPIKQARLFITALGVYEATLNGKRVGDFVLAPGWTSYHKRLQYQEYDVTSLLQDTVDFPQDNVNSLHDATDSPQDTVGFQQDAVKFPQNNASFQQDKDACGGSGQNILQVMVGKGWYRSPMPGWGSRLQDELRKNPPALLAQLEIQFTDGSAQLICTDAENAAAEQIDTENAGSEPAGAESADAAYTDADCTGTAHSNGDCPAGEWKVGESPVRFSEIYDGEIYDGSFTAAPEDSVEVFDGPFHTLIPQQGEEIREQERILAARIFTTPKGETVVDFGQEVTGYVETAVTASRGDVVDLSFAEVMDQEGNFYTENYRGAKAQYHYICREGAQVYKPRLTFWGFRYIRVNQFPGGAASVRPECFTAVAVHSQMTRTGYLRCSNELLNRFFDNCVWGQKGNFLDVPTDCPQRDERLGWTGDAQVFVRTACLNYDAEKFFAKWLADLAADQGEDGYVGHVIPDLLHNPDASAAWGDAATICPWEVYLAYGNPGILEDQFESMHKWVDYITLHTAQPGLWTGMDHYGDWLALDVPTENCSGASRKDFIASAFYAHSTALVIKAGKVLGRDISAYETLYQEIVQAFRKAYPVYETQTECVLAAHFGLAEDPEAAVRQLAGMIRECGVHLKTGFVGTPYLLHVLSRFGYAELAYSLLLREEYPSWLYPVTKGATTVWEHWDGIMTDGGFWSPGMNSFNHYAYGSVADWVYGVAAGITPIEEAPGYAKVRIAPIPDKRLEWLEASLDTRHGKILSKWRKAEELWRYEITTPVEAVIVIDGTEHHVEAGTYYYYSEQGIS